jgi:PAS domain S-box-containing protein
MLLRAGWLPYNRIDPLREPVRLGLSEPTIKISPVEHILRLSRTAEEIRARLAAHDAKIGRKQDKLPQGITESLRQLSGTLLTLKENIEAGERQRRDLQALTEIGRIVNSSLDLTIVLNEVMDTIIRLMGAQRAFLMLRDEEGELQFLAARNWERQDISSDEWEVSRTIIEQVVRRGEPVVTTNARTDPRFDRQSSIVAYNLRSIICVPLKVKGALTGVIYTDNRAREGLFTHKELSLLAAFADQAAVALENARLFDSVKRSLAEVTELKNLMEDVFESIESGVITSDTEDQITLCNRAARGILESSRAAELGASLRELLPMLSPDLVDQIAEVKEGEARIVGVEVHPELPERGPVDLSLNISPLKSADGNTKGVALVIDDLTEKRRLEAQRRLFERMVPPSVIDQLDPDALQLGGQRGEITTLFADIRGYTSFSESTDPETLVTVLNQYLAAAAEAILAEEGTIDKFMGDAILAWFNAPIPQLDHTLRAVRAAVAITSAVEDLHRILPDEFHLSYGVGIHFGEAVLGLVGTQSRLEYTAIGDSVNTAKRLQEKAAHGQILMSHAAASRVREKIEVEELSSIPLEGKEQPIRIYRLLGFTQDSSSDL